MDVEHLVEPFPASWTSKGWTERLNELGAQGWRFVQAVDTVDGWRVILIRTARPPAASRRG